MHVCPCVCIVYVSVSPVKTVDSLAPPSQAFGVLLLLWNIYDVLCIFFGSSRAQLVPVMYILVLQRSASWSRSAVLVKAA